MRSAPGWILALSFAIPAAHAGPTIGGGTEGKPFIAAYSFGKPTVMVPPEYPAEALARSQGASVAVKGTILATGELADATISANGDPAFEKAVREVLHYWRFVPEMTETCAFRESPAAYTIIFEIVEDKPKISVARAAPPAAPEVVTSVPATRTRKSPVFPRAALERGIEGSRLVAYLPVAADGSVSEPVVLPGPFPAEFGKVVREALREWTFEPSPEWPAGRQRLCVELSVEFRLAQPRFSGIGTGYREEPRPR